MASQPASELLGESPAEGGQWEVTLKLACGCVVRCTVAQSRIVETVDGRRIAVGKYPCPVSHAAGRY
jgi:hypothetical protein